MRAAPTASVSVKRPNLLATVLGNVFNPFAGTAPNAPTPESPLSWVMAAATRKELSRAAVNVDPASPALMVNGLTITPGSPQTVTGIYNRTTAGPAVNQSLQGYQKFNTVDEDGNLGTFYAYVSTAPYLTAPTSSRVLYVDSGIADLLGESPGAGALPDGSVISTSSLGSFVNVYSAIAGADPNSGNDDTVTDILTNTRTGKTIDLSSLVNGLGFNAADVSPVLPDYIRGVGDPTITSVSALPPLTIAPQGYQTFEYLDADGNTIGHFNAVVTTTKDAIGFSTEALLVTGYPDAGRGEAPPIGTVYNTIDYGNWEVVYSSIPQDGTDEVTVILANTRTQDALNISWLYQGFDASKGLTDGTNIWSFDFGDGYTVAPTQAQQVFTGVNGLPPVSATVSAIQEFNVMQGSDSAGTFTATLTTIPTMLLTHDVETLLVTDSSSSAVPVGSVFEVESLGLGFVHVYSDLVGAGVDGQNLITDALLTPWGTAIDVSWLYQGVDVAAGLKPGGADPLVSYTNENWLGLFSQF